MPSSTYLSNPALVEIGGVDLTDQCSAVTVNYNFDALEATAFGDTARLSVKGLQNNSATVTLYMSYAATETYATLQPLVGTQTTLKVKPNSGNEGATNPIQILTNCLLAALPVANMALGELSTVDIELIGGTYSVDITPPA